MMCILINYYKTMHTTHLSEMTDDASISLTCDLWALVDNNLSNLPKSKETREMCKI